MPLVREKQIEFPPEQTQVRWLTPALIGLSIVCVVVVVIVLLVHESGSFIGPW